MNTLFLVRKWFSLQRAFLIVCRHFSTGQGPHSTAFQLPGAAKRADPCTMSRTAPQNRFISLYLIYPSIHLPINHPSSLSTAVVCNQTWCYYFPRRTGWCLRTFLLSQLGGPIGIWRAETRDADPYPTLHMTPHVASHVTAKTLALPLSIYLAIYVWIYIAMYLSLLSIIIYLVSVTW